MQLTQVSRNTTHTPATAPTSGLTYVGVCRVALLGRHARGARAPARCARARRSHTEPSLRNNATLMFTVVCCDVRVCRACPGSPVACPGSPVA
eukprot:1369860-Prymnesium_polylepis.2